MTCLSTEGAVVSDRRCGLRKPAVKEVCDMGSCAQGWYHTKWTNQVLQQGHPVLDEYLMYWCIVTVLGFVSV